MFPFRKPPTKLEIAKKSVSDAAHTLREAIPTAQIEEKFEGLKKGASLAAVAAAGAVHHAGEVAAHKFEEVKHAASHFGEGATSTAQTAAQSARETAQNARESLGEKAKTASNFKQRIAQDFQIGGKEAQNAKTVAAQALQREAEAVKARAAAIEAKKQAKFLDKEAENTQKQADQLAAQARQTALQAAAKAKAAQEQARAEAQEAEAREQEEKERAEAETQAQFLGEKAAKKAAKIEAKARGKAEKAARESDSGSNSNSDSGRDESEVRLAEVQIADGGSKWGWIVVGLAVGAALALLLAPTSGRRSRAAIKDRLGKVGDGAVDATTATADKIVDIAHRVEGLANNVEAKIAADSENDDDSTIADRVRSVLGHHEVAKSIERLNIDCADGVITLRGPMLDQATQDILVTAIQTVPGVKEVTADFLRDEAPENPANS